MLDRETPQNTKGFFFTSEVVSLGAKVEIFLEQREVAFLSPSKIFANLNFSREIQIFANLQKTKPNYIQIPFIWDWDLNFGRKELGI